MIFTFAPERTVRASFIAEVERLIRQSRGRVDVVALVCPLAELKGCMECESQRKF
jgi:predicted aconitase